MINCRCNQNVDNGELMVQCNTCNSWVHAKCFNVSGNDLCVQKESCEWFCSPTCVKPARFVENCLWYQNQYPVRIVSTFGSSNDHLNRYVLVDDLESILQAPLINCIAFWTNHYFPASFLPGGKYVMTREGLEHYLKKWIIRSKKLRKFLYDSVLPLLK